MARGAGRNPRQRAVARPHALPRLRRAAASCKACPLWERGTQTVFGDGTRTAEIMLVGEQPGDREDLAGEPFVGPAGRILDKALAQAGLDPRKSYITNVVKHFKWVARGKRRIHKKPNMAEISACRPWLDAEISVVQPKAIIALGATAAQALIGRDFRVTKQRGEPIDSTLAEVVRATVHPSSKLRADEEDRQDAMDGLVSDLKAVASRLRDA